MKIELKNKSGKVLIEFVKSFPLSENEFWDIYYLQKKLFYKVMCSTGHISIDQE